MNLKDKWITRDGGFHPGDGVGMRICGNCGWYPWATGRIPVYKFCPECGIKKDVGSVLNVGEEGATEEYIQSLPFIANQRKAD